MISIWLALLIGIVFMVVNYATFYFGLQIGKALQKEIPKVPAIEYIENFIEKVYEKTSEPKEDKSKTTSKDDRETSVGLYD